MHVLWWWGERGGGVFLLAKCSSLSYLPQSPTKLTSTVCELPRLIWQNYFGDTLCHLLDCEGKGQREGAL